MAEEEITGQHTINPEEVVNVLKGISTNMLWEEIYYRDFQYQAFQRGLSIDDEDLRGMAKDAHSCNDDEEEDLLRRNEDFFDNLENADEEEKGEDI